MYDNQDVSYTDVRELIPSHQLARLYKPWMLLNPEPWHLDLYVGHWNSCLLEYGRSRVLRRFIGMCMSFLDHTDTYERADTLAQICDNGRALLLLNLPAVYGLHERLSYINLLRQALDEFLDAKYADKGEAFWAAQMEFIDTLHTELLRRREAWKVGLRQRLIAEGRDREVLTAAVWHPRRMERWLADCDGDPAKEDLLLRGWAYESEGTHK